MHIEDRIEKLEAENRQLRDRLEKLEQYGLTRFVTVKELARLMDCSIQNIHRKIKVGDIQVTRKLGDPRIPMSQFVKESEKPVREPRQKKSRELTMAEKVFG